MKVFPTICGSVAGKPSPLGVRLHNAGYRELGIDYQYVAFGSDDIDEALDLARRLGMRGLGVSMPHKLSVIERLDHVGSDVERIGACNTVIFDGSATTGRNTDWIGARDAWREAGVEPRTVEVIGAGGVARAICYALKESGADVFVLARRAEAASELARNLDLAGAGEIHTQGSRDADMVVNATPDSGPASPLRLDAHAKLSAVFDVVFSPRTTPLTEEATRRGLIVVPGWRMLLHQGLEQFRLYTGHEPPVGAMSEVLERALA